MEALAEQPEAIPTPLKLPNAATSNSSFPIKPKTSLPSIPSRPFTRGLDYLIHLGKQGLKDLYDIDDLDSPKDEHEKFMTAYYEVGVIEKTNYINYFLVVADFINMPETPAFPWARPRIRSRLASRLLTKNHHRRPPRLQSNLRTLSQPRPRLTPRFRHRLLPDSPQDVIRYVREKYGDECVAQIITFKTLGAKTLMRDLGRVLEIDSPIVTTLPK